MVIAQRSTSTDCLPLLTLVLTLLTFRVIKNPLGDRLGFAYAIRGVGLSPDLNYLQEGLSYIQALLLYQF